MLRQAFKIGVGNQFCSMRRSTHYILNILHISVCWFCCPHQPRCCPLFFHVGPQIHTFHLSPPKTVISPLLLMLFFIFFPSPPVPFFFQIDPLNIIVSLHITSTFKFFLFLLLKGSSLAKSFCFLKMFKKLKGVNKVWLDNITSCFVASYSVRASL